MARLQALSPWTYGPRRRRSPRVVLVWTVTFLFLLYITWRITSGRRSAAAAAAASAQEVHDRMLKGRADSPSPGGAGSDTADAADTADTAPPRGQE